MRGLVHADAQNCFTRRSLCVPEVASLPRSQHLKKRMPRNRKLADLDKKVGRPFWGPVTVAILQAGPFWGPQCDPRFGPAGESHGPFSIHTSLPFLAIPFALGGGGGNLLLSQRQGLCLTRGDATPIPTVYFCRQRRSVCFMDLWLALRLSRQAAGAATALCIR